MSMFYEWSALYQERLYTNGFGRGDFVYIPLLEKNDKVVVHKYKIEKIEKDIKAPIESISNYRVFISRKHHIFFKDTFLVSLGMLSKTNQEARSRFLEIRQNYKNSLRKLP